MVAKESIPLRRTEKSTIFHAWFFLRLFDPWRWERQVAPKRR